jgi:hypothetical protein
MVGLVLGGIYALGALNLYGQLLAADVAPRQVLTQVPIEQLLARGIASLLTPVALLVALLLLVVGLSALLEMAVGKGADQNASPKESSVAGASKGKWKIVDWLLHLDEKPLPVAVFVAGFLALFAPPLMCLSLLGSFAIAVSVMILLKSIVDWDKEGDSWKIMVSWMTAATLCGAIFNSFLQANPLPEAVLNLRDRSCVEGGVVLETGDTWFIKLEDDQVAAIPSRNVDTSQVHYRNVPIESSLMNVLGVGPPRQLAGDLVQGCRRSLPRPHS